MFVTLRNLTVGSRLKNSLQCLSTSLSFCHEFKSSTHQFLHHLLEKCTSMRELRQLHAQIILHRLTLENLTLGKLIAFCAVADAGDIRYSQIVFDQVIEPNKFMYNSLIRGYSNSDAPLKSLLLYRKMICSGLSPNEFTLPFVLKVCAGTAAFWDAVVVHGHAIKLGTGCQVCVQNGLINVYISFGLIRCARDVFDDISHRTLVSWNTMIGGYSKVGCCEEAFLLFREMRESGLKPDKFTLVNLLSVCSQSCDLDLGRFVHLHIEITGVEIDQIVRNALLDMYAKCGSLKSSQTVFDTMSDKNVVSWTSLVCGYAKNGLIESAKAVFDKMPVKNVVSWNAMISCYVREGRFNEALALFSKMQRSKVIPDKATLVSILSACSQIGNSVMGEEIYKYICNSNMELGVTLWNSLADMFAKCGALETALHLFLKSPEKNIVSWNVIIGALALHGCGPKAIEMFEDMQARGVLPDTFTFTGLLSACSHSGLVDAGRYYFDRMKSFYGISPELEHYACMVDLFGRVGLLGEAVRLIGGMTLKPDVVIWGALLGACRIHGNVEIGKQILKQLLELGPHSSGPYVLLSNIFCEAKRWEDAKKIRALMKDGKVTKSRAISFIEINNHVNEFMADDQRHQLSSSIYTMIDQLTDHLRSCSFFDIDEMQGLV
ncbi:pentatricopeptide repeat-containing protein At2g22410, mitochondrial-like [Humulus lupulus]|uniref:pentatricopeptide repeat-containing protein At2g22410, mitochondrial-like n=1 Tax=Humulus lupulus TaxID=3486 RepID=UPI002B4047D7|nr:pentatricopeptide repeat-containing protein At2g22410, mitochondrial-like [Humulus lupulus]